jgi:hypothetical protein
MEEVVAHLFSLIFHSLFNHRTLEGMKQMLNYRLDVRDPRAEISPVAEIVHLELREAVTVVSKSYFGSLFYVTELLILCLNSELRNSVTHVLHRNTFSASSRL